MDRNNLKDILLLQEKKNGFDKEFTIKRTLSNNINSFDDTDFIIIISGVRRCGKSVLLDQIRKPDSYYINFDDERFINFTVNDFQQMYELLIELFGRKKYFYFDEIQNITGWERFVRRLHNQGNKIFITGSNASMLSKEMGTHLTGRNIMRELYPFSFREFLRFKGKAITNIEKLTSIETAEIRKLFLEYLDNGGFPEYLQTGKTEYLQNLYENILYRDIITRFNIRSEKALKITSFYAASNVSKDISFNKLKNITGLTSATTIKNYFHYLENSYLVFLLSRYNYSLQKQIYYNKKVYFIDSKLANIVGFRFSEDKGRMLENVVFLDLKRNNKEIFFHREKRKCDFLIKQGANITKAIQVTWNLNEKNRTREFQGLLEAMNNYGLDDGLILTFTEESLVEKEGKKIVIMPVWKWLLDD